MRKVNSRELLMERSQLFQSFLGRPGTYDGGRIPFQGKAGPFHLSFDSKKSVMSINHLLTLQAEVALPQALVQDRLGPQEARCYLNRLGGWSYRGRHPLLQLVARRLKTDKALMPLVRQTDLESLEIKLGAQGIEVVAKLYGGGYSATILPPIQFPVGLSPEQAKSSAVLLRGLVKILQELCGVSPKTAGL